MSLKIQIIIKGKIYIFRNVIGKYILIFYKYIL